MVPVKPSIYFIEGFAFFEQDLIIGITNTEKEKNLF